ncbi:MAG TPA: N(5)-(carboxyethyl)ornithine synthase [Actinomycetota bacterium]|nr:N(5)-(carboxyethyl)ornithine synthase [Actinomycetota bacterium]
MASFHGELALGVVGGSRKENELRLALHPSHLPRIDAALRERIALEEGYGGRFGVSDEELASYVGGVCSREELIEECDVIVIPKPLPDDLLELRPGQVVWGWPHCVQDELMTQNAIERRLTLIAWEAMNEWGADGRFGVHVFHKNNELAGYCSVLHALQLTGRTGQYGPSLRAAVISFGATARGAVTALHGLGVSDVTVLTQRDPAAVASPIPSIHLVHFDPTGPRGRPVAFPAPGPVEVPALLAEHDIVVNCVLQDTDAPLVFVTRDELARFASGTLVVDVSCDEGMGFEWARPTSFVDPMFTVGDGVKYYAVDHSPSFLWDSATWEISNALLPHLPTVMGGPAAWDSDDTIGRAIEIRDGVIRNPKILTFQRRSPAFPHAAS